MDTTAKHWYQEPWPWILAAGPALVVVAGIATAVIAYKTNDGLVTEDYYKKGLAVNQTIAQSDRAATAGIQAGVKITSETLSVRLSVKDTSFQLPSTLVVTLSHPTRAGLDQTRVLTQSGGSYSGEFRLPASGHWLILIEDESKNWRLMGNVILPASGEMIIGGAAPDPRAPADRN